MAGKAEQSDLYMDFEEFIEEEHEGNNGDESEESEDEADRSWEDQSEEEDAGDVFSSIIKALDVPHMHIAS